MPGKIEVHNNEAQAIWQNLCELNDAERDFHAKGNSQSPAGKKGKKGQKVDGLAGMVNAEELSNRVKTLELENLKLKQVSHSLEKHVQTLESRLQKLELGNAGGGGDKKSVPTKQTLADNSKDDDDEDDDVDLFGSDDEEESEDAKRVREERLKAYAEKKAKKTKVIAKTSVLLDVKPWDDETNLDDMLSKIKSIAKDGLVWGASKKVPVGYGISKLQVLCVVEDEKVSIDELSEDIEGFEDFVQSVDVASMQKI